MRKSIYFPVSGEPYICDICIGDSDKKKTLNSVLKSEYLPHDTMDHLVKHGYVSCLYWRDPEIKDKQAIENKLATKISVLMKKNNDIIKGPAILIDDNKDLTLDDIPKILKLTEEFDEEEYNKKTRERARQLDPNCPIS